MLSLSNSEKDLLRKISSHHIVVNDSDNICLFKFGAEIIESYPLTNYDTDTAFSTIYSELITKINCNGFFPKEVPHIIDSNCIIRTTETKYMDSNGYMLFLEGHCYLENKLSWSSLDKENNELLLTDNSIYNTESSTVKNFYLFIR